VIPYGGGTSVAGHVTPRAEDAPVVTVDVSRLARLVGFDTRSRLATFEAGICGPRLEAILSAQGYTLGHFPQSFEYSTLGGWVATRSCGQQSLHYGRIEALFAGGELATPRGSLALPALPASAAGPDLRQMVLGSEGRLGILTRLTMRVRPAPAREAFYGFFLPTWEDGVEAVRALAQAGVPLSMLRLSDALETEVNLRLAGHPRLVRWGRRGLGVLGYGNSRCLLLMGVTQDRGQRHWPYAEAVALARAGGGLPAGQIAGRAWARNRFRSPYLRNTLWEAGYAVDTLETALPWAQVLPAAATVRAAVADGLEPFGERVLAIVHLSHVYGDGASVYVTYLFRRAADPDETLARWRVLKDAASRQIVAHGGTISHQHGVGVDHLPYLAAEKGSLGLVALEAARAALDPAGLMNPGKLLEA
jgi:alkyldihydroxyacetonephosphate synthase